jgi:predicted permease
MATVDIVLPVFLVIGCGWFLRVIGFLQDETAGTLTRLVFYVSAPALLLRGAAGAPVARSLQGPSLPLIIGLTVVFAFGVYACVLRRAPARRGVLAQGAHRSNMVFMGLPIVAYAYGDAVLGQAAVLIGIMVVVYNLLGILLLVLPHQSLSYRHPAVWRGTAAKILRNPLILSSGAGIVLSLLGLGLPLALDRALDLVGRTALPLALVAVGAGLDFGRLRAETGVTAVVAVLKLVVYPGLVWLGLRWLGFTGVELAVPVLILASPTAVVSYIMAREMDGDAQLAGAIVIGTTTLSALTFLGWLAVLGR